jgi:hypothetical protein
MQETLRTDIYKDLKSDIRNVKTDETVGPTIAAQLTKNMTFQSVSKLNECYDKYINTTECYKYSIHTNILNPDEKQNM